jgi:hypothetical protein
MKNLRALDYRPCQYQPGDMNDKGLALARMGYGPYGSMGAAPVKRRGIVP